MIVGGSCHCKCHTSPTEAVPYNSGYNPPNPQKERKIVDVHLGEPWISVEGVLYDFDQGIITQTQALHMIKKYATSDCEEPIKPTRGISHISVAPEERANSDESASKLIPSPSQEAGWEKKYAYKGEYSGRREGGRVSGSLGAVFFLEEDVKKIRSTLLTDKAKVLLEEIEGMMFENPKEAEQFSLHADGYNQALEDVLETITRILR